MVRRESKKKSKIRHSGHFVDQKLKRTNIEDVVSLISYETQKKIGVLSPVKIRAIGIRLSPAQDKLIHALFRLLHEKSENRDLKSNEFYGGNEKRQIIQYGGGGKIAESSTIRIFPSELYKAYTDSFDYTEENSRIGNLSTHRTEFVAYSAS